MSSSSPPATPGPAVDDITAMMMASSPLRPGVRRPREDDDYDGNDNDLLSGPQFSSISRAPSLNTNEFIAIKRYATRKRLKVDLFPDLEEFYTAGQTRPTVHDGFSFVNGLLTHQKIDEVITLQPKWGISKDLKVNIDSITYAAILSPSARLYKGDTLTSTVLKIIIDRGFDIPKSIDSNPAMKKTLTTTIKTAMTEARSQIKKDLAKSVGVKATADDKQPKPSMSNAAAHQPVVVLAETISRHCADGFQVTVEFCARVALMRRVYMRDNSNEFWNILVEELQRIHHTAHTTPDPQTGSLPTPDEVAKRVTKAFRGILDNDRKNHGDPNDNRNNVIAAMPTQPDAHQVSIDNALQPAATGSGNSVGEEANL